MDKLEAFLREHLGSHPEDLVAHTSGALGIQADEVKRVLDRLVEGGEFERVVVAGRSILRWKPALRARIEPGLEEDRIWMQVIAPRLATAPQNVQRILDYGATEMLNNVLDHSEARELVVVVRRLVEEIEVHIEDDGIGIFRKLQRDKGLDDPQHVALELSKGKLTTDPERHTGQGIFFTTRMCDKFLIWSGTTACGQVNHGEWNVRSADPRPGTTIRMSVRLDTSVTPKTIFDEFFPLGADGDFSKTRIPVALVQQNGAGFISRSQAKRLLARCELFREVVLDFTGIDSIGPAFADEIFRVFVRSHPEVVVTAENVASPDIARMIASARRNGGSAT